MPWVEFTADHVKARLAARELEIYEETASAESDEGEPSTPTPRLPLIVAQLIARIRGLVRANPRVTAMGPEGTIPDGCVFHAAVIGRVALIGLNPVPEGMTDPRRDEYRAAEKFLESLPSMNPSAFGDDLPAASAPATTPVYGGNPLLEF
jgi:hypothetical protein